MEQPDEHYSLVGGNLVITNPKEKKHTGTYVCVARNIYGTVISKEARLKFGGNFSLLLFVLVRGHSVLFKLFSLSSSEGVSAGGERPCVREGRTGGRSAVCPPKGLAR